MYESDFKGFSYGFRPGRGAHDALAALSVGITRCKISWVLDADIRGFTGRWLQSVVSGWQRYYAVPRTYRWLRAFRLRVMWLWWRAIRRRGDKRKTTWSQVYRLADRWLPLPRILHPYPDQRLAVMTQGRSPVR